jgi:hypothetical protein
MTPGPPIRCFRAAEILPALRVLAGYQREALRPGGAHST